DRWQRQPTFEQAFSTGRGQQRVVTLPDDALAGSSLQLDTATQLHATLFRDRREVRLEDGQAMFTVHADPKRPFHVRAGSLRITVVGTRFSVRHTASGIDAGKTVVSVEEGQVRVVRVGTEAGPSPGQAAAPVELTAGLMLVAAREGTLGRPVAVAPAAVAQWRSGRIAFDHTPLRDALAEFERYGRTGLVVNDPAVAALPVGGSYNLRQFQQFARTLPEVLPVRLVPAGDSLEIVAR
ncbi:MAG: FecR domain-containing protein, partial [Burkholderiaceae bacterium]